MVHLDSGGGVEGDLVQAFRKYHKSLLGRKVDPRQLSELELLLIKEWRKAQLNIPFPRR